MNCFNDLIKLQLAMNNVKRFTSSRFALLSSIMKPIMCRESKGIPLLPLIIVMLFDRISYKILLLLLLMVRNCEFECIPIELKHFQDYLLSAN